MNVQHVCRRSLTRSNPFRRFYATDRPTNQSGAGLGKLARLAEQSEREAHNKGDSGRQDLNSNNDKGSAGVKQRRHKGPTARSLKDPLKSVAPEDRVRVSSENLSRLNGADYNCYADTEAPVSYQLDYANKFFAPSDHSPIHLWATGLFRTIPLSDVPEVVFIGRSNVGKSMLINSLVGKGVCNTSTKPGRTKEFHAYGIGGTKGGDSKITLIDVPGYGKGSKTEWGEEILKYMKGRKQLRRVFLLIDSARGLKPNDREVINLFHENAVPYQIVLTKIDGVLIKGGMKKSRGFHPARLAEVVKARKSALKGIEAWGLPPPPGVLRDVLACSSKLEKGMDMKTLGIDSVRWAIMRAAGLDQLAQPPSGYRLRMVQSQDNVDKTSQ